MTALREIAARRFAAIRHDLETRHGDFARSRFGGGGFLCGGLGCCCGSGGSCGGIRESGGGQAGGYQLLPLG